MKKALLFWSSGKDSAYALHLLRRQGDVEVVGLVTTVNRPVRRIAVHAVRERLLTAQAQACGLAVKRVAIPDPSSNQQYEAAVGAALAEGRARGINAVVFGDLFLEDIRAYRERLLAGSGIEPLFPLWGRDTRELATEMLAAGMRARLSCVDLKALPAPFAGRDYDLKLLAELPAGVDPCGENGEFHTFVYAGPMFRRPIAVRPGRVIERDGFAYADLLVD
jgi:uncharacterized protein (TIGR00290 family)